MKTNYHLIRLTSISMRILAAQERSIALQEKIIEDQARREKESVRRDFMNRLEQIISSTKTDHNLYIVRSEDPHVACMNCRQKFVGDSIDSDSISRTSCRSSEYTPFGRGSGLY